MQDLYTVTINGTKLHVDAEDASFMERYQAAYDAMSANPADTLNDNPATVIRKYCQSYRNFLMLSLAMEQLRLYLQECRTMQECTMKFLPC